MVAVVVCVSTSVDEEVIGAGAGTATVVVCVVVVVVVSGVAVVSTVVPGSTSGALPGRPGAVAVVVAQLPRSGQHRERYLGVKIPPTTLQEHHLEQARRFADALADRLPDGAATAVGSDPG